ncbi:uncharacterized protein [Solanum lycopersicum]|uniref:uncharacterized protein n=1 Tax=Solanum lycopersicum TaxID=4081 RepID=UPI0002BC94EA
MVENVDLNCWFDAIVIRPWSKDLLKESLDKVKLIQDGLLMAQSRQKSYADQKVRDLELMVEEQVLLKVSSMKVVMTFEIKGKLIPRYICPFKSVDHIGDVVYESSLPHGLSSVHPIFHILILKKYHQSGAHVIQC